MNTSGEIFAHDPIENALAGRPPISELIECSLCGSTFSITTVKDGTLNLDAKRCPKCPENNDG